MIEYRRERLEKVQAEIETLLPRQWEETGDEGLDCAPNWIMYQSIENLGGLVLIMAREDKRAIGYLAAFIHPHVNSMNSKVATISTYYVEERPMRANIMRHMIASALMLLGELGLRRITIETEYEHSAGRLLSLMGFHPSKVGYVLDPAETSVGHA
jgi:hypothetical protein